MVVLNDRQMFECKVLYIGSAPPIDTLEGTEALQEPLRQRYPEDLGDVRGIDSILRVKPDCLEMLQKDSDMPIQFPLDRLKICAAVRSCVIRDATSGENVRQFVPLNTVAPETSQPAIFAAIIRRSQGREIAECHAFVCSSPREALHLVNTTAAANLNLKALRGQRMSESVKYQDGVPVIHDVQNGHGVMNGEEVRYVVGGERHEQYNGTDNDTIYIKSSIEQVDVPQEVTQEPVRHYIQNVDDNYKFAQQQEVIAPSPKTIYIKFDKSNLVPTGSENTMELQRSTIQYQTPQPRPVVMQAPQPRMIRAVAPPQPVPMMYRRTMSPRPVYVRSPPPQPMVMSPPPPPQQVFMPPPQPVLVPAPSRMYARRVMSPPPPRLVAPPPVYYKTRARSSSPDFTRSEIRGRVIQPNKYQPKWRSHSSDIVEYRQSRRDMVPQAPPPMFMNERAFARRVNTDNRFTGYAVPGYNYPTAYDFHDVMMYDRPISKSNPRYSSSSSEEGDLRFNRKKR